MFSMKVHLASHCWKCVNKRKSWRPNVRASQKIIETLVKLNIAKKNILLSHNANFTQLDIFLRFSNASRSPQQFKNKTFSCHLSCLSSTIDLHLLCAPALPTKPRVSTSTITAPLALNIPLYLVRPECPVSVFHTEKEHVWPGPPSVTSAPWTVAYTLSATTSKAGNSPEIFLTY